HHRTSYYDHLFVRPHHLPSLPTRRSSDLLNDEFRAGLSPELADFVAGPVPARVTMTGRGGGSRTLQAEFDLTDASMSVPEAAWSDRKSTRLNSSHVKISYAVICFKKKKRD